MPCKIQGWTAAVGGNVADKSHQLGVIVLGSMRTNELECMQARAAAAERALDRKAWWDATKSLLRWNLRSPNRLDPGSAADPGPGLVNGALWNGCDLAEVGVESRCGNCCVRKASVKGKERMCVWRRACVVKVWERTVRVWRQACKESARRVWEWAMREWGYPHPYRSPSLPLSSPPFCVRPCSPDYEARGPKLKPCSRETLRLTGAASGCRRHYSCTFDSCHFALLNLAVASTLKGFTTKAALKRWAPLPSALLPALA
eukprot:354581-Chlamydomonas_euryale.AAC.2